MIVNFTVSNFLSFKNPSTISFITGSSDNLPEHSVKCYISCLKNAAIFGHNGSGKTNFVLAFEYLKRIITGKKDSLLSKNNIKRLENRVSCKIDNTDHISEFILIVEEIGDTTPLIYKYALSYNSVEKIFINESIEIIYKDYNETLITRDLNKISIKTAEINKNRMLNEIDSSKSILNYFRNNDNGCCPMCVNSIFNHIYNFKIISYGDMIPRDEYICPSNKKNIILDELRKYTEINDYFTEKIAFNLLDIEKTSVNEYKNGIYLKKGILFEMAYEYGKKVAYEYKFKENNKIIPYSQLSTGVKRILDIIILSTDWSEKEKYCSQKTIIIDEICYSLHPNLTKKIIKNLIENNDVLNQFIFTLHETEIISPNIIRNDEIWFIEKNNNISELFSLEEFDSVSNSVKKSYLNGRYGAVPQFGNVEEI